MLHLSGIGHFVFSLQLQLDMVGCSFGSRIFRLCADMVASMFSVHEKLILIVLVLKILESGLLVGKCFLISLMNSLPNLVVTDRLKGGLYQMTRLFLFLRFFLLLLGSSFGWLGSGY